MHSNASTPGRIDLTGALVAGRFHVLRQIGKGGYGEVYAAQQVSMGRPVALKVLWLDLTDDPRVIERFNREANQTSQLTHTNTVVCYDFGEDRERRLIYLAMEYLDGCSLLDALEREGSLSPMRTLNIVEQIAASLQEAHSRGIIHRDLKPANIMLINREGNSSFIKVIDFGISMIFNPAYQEPSEGQARLTRNGMVMGTPFYMAPEQIRHQPLDHRVDVYALGVLAFEMLTGQRPFTGMTPIEIMRKHLEATPPLAHHINPSLPAGLSALLSWAMAKRPEDRPASVTAFATAFSDALLQGQDNTARVGGDQARSLQHLLQAAHASAGTTKMSPQDVMAAIQASQAQASQAQASQAQASQADDAYPSSGTARMSPQEVAAALRASQLAWGDTKEAEADAAADAADAADEDVGAEPTSQMTLADVQALMRQQQRAAQQDEDDLTVAPSGAYSAPSLSPAATPTSTSVARAPSPSAQTPMPPAAARRGPSPMTWVLIATACVGALIALLVAWQ
jgi:serine/threonine protein kinase